MPGATPPSLPSTLQGWLTYVEKLHARPIEMGLERFTVVLERLGLRPARVSVVVAGTNGKGSTCAMLEAIYLAAGYRVGKYASPHLLRFTERIRVDAQEAEAQALCHSFARVEAARGQVGLTYFEFTTLVAFCYFETAQVDIAVLEVGLGGRLDAVNAIDADCAIVTTVDLDHTDWLGDTREQIGWEKAHVFRAGRPAVCADPNPPLSLLDFARTLQAPLFCLGRDFWAENLDPTSAGAPGRQWNYRGVTSAGSRYALPQPALRGPHQLRNAAGVLAVIEQLMPVAPVDQQAVRQGLTQVTLPGRFQIWPGLPTIVLDVAHNAHAAAALAQALDQHHGPQAAAKGKTLAVFGMLRDKDATAVVNALKQHVDEWYLAGTVGDRGLDSRQLQDVLTAVLQPADKASAEAPDSPPVCAFDDVQNALKAAQENAGRDDRIVVFGSFLVVAEAVRCLERNPR